MSTRTLEGLSDRPQLAKMPQVGWFAVAGVRSFHLGLLVAALALPARAIPRLDLTAYPAPAAGETRWVIQLPGLLPPHVDTASSPNPRDWRVQVIVGQLVKADCNQLAFSAHLHIDHPQAHRELSYLRVSEVGPLASTQVACLPNQPLRERFVERSGKPFVMTYNVSQPIVVYAPKPLEVRWKLWKAEVQQRPARAL